MLKEEFGYEEHREIYKIIMEKAIKALPVWKRHKFNTTQHLTNNKVIVDSNEIIGEIVYDDNYRISILDQDKKFIFGWEWDFAGGRQYYSHFCGNIVGKHSTTYVS